MKYSALGVLGILASCANGPEAHLPRGTFKVISDCPDSTASGEESVSVNREETILTITNATSYGFQAEEVQISFDPGQYTLSVGSEENVCSAYWNSGFSDNYVFVCKSNGTIICSISLKK